MSAIRLDGRRFRGVDNYDDGDFDASVTFDYRQSGDLVWATFRGDQIRMGNIVGRMYADGLIRLRFQYVDREGALKSGSTESRASLLEDGRAHVEESWRSDLDGSTGTSAIEEFRR